MRSLHFLDAGAAQLDAILRRGGVALVPEVQVHPYRKNSAPHDAEASDEEDESGDDRLVLWVALLVSLLGLTSRLSDSSPWGAEPTIALLIAIGSAIQLGRYGLLALRRKR